MIRKIMILSTVSLVSFGAFAQSKKYSAPTTSFGISGGVNWNNINGENSTGDKLENNVLTGFNVGLNVEFPVGNGFYLQPGVEYRQKGSELSNGNKMTLSYVDVPVTFIYKPVLGMGSMLLGFGPYVGFGINGTVKSPDGTKRKVTFDNSYSLGDAEDLQFKKLDAGANLMIGYEFQCKLSAAVKAQLGLMDINSDTNIPGDQTRNRNTSFGISLGYRL